MVDSFLAIPAVSTIRSTSLFTLGLIAIGTSLLIWRSWFFAVAVAYLALSPLIIISYLYPKEIVAPYVVNFWVFDAAAPPPPSWVAWLVLVLVLEAGTVVHSPALPVEVLPLAMVDWRC